MRRRRHNEGDRFIPVPPLDEAADPPDLGGDRIELERADDGELKVGHPDASDPQDSLWADDADPTDEIALSSLVDFPHGHRVRRSAPTSPGAVDDGPRVLRLPALVVIVSLLIAGGVLEHTHPRAVAPRGRASAPLVPQVAPAGALTSDWFCPAMTASAPAESAPAPSSVSAAADATALVPAKPATRAGGAPVSPAEGQADGQVLVANRGATLLTGRLTVIPTEGQPKDVSITIAPRSRMSYRLGAIAPAAWAAALVQLDGASGAVEQQVSGPLGQDTTPCSTAASDAWYFAGGTTDRDATLLVSLFNPFPGDAIIDFTFATDLGPAAPSDLQGVVVPGRGVAVVNVSDRVPRRALISTALTARSGRVVAEKLQLRSGPPGAPRGITLTLGAAAPASSWTYPDGVVDDGVDERLELYNPSDRAAEVKVTVALDRGSAEPLSATVPPRGRASVAMASEGRIPKGIAHATVVSSTNGVPVVAERIITTTPPSTRAGISDTPGSPAAARQWVFAGGQATTTWEEWLVLYNPGPLAADVRVIATSAGATLPLGASGSITLAAGERRAQRLGEDISAPEVVLSIDATQPIVAERDLYRTGGPGVSAAIGIIGSGGPS